MNTREELLSALTARPVPFTAGGRSCFLKPLLVEDLLAVQAWAKAREGNGGSHKFLFVRSVCNEAGERLLTDEDTGIVDTLLGGFVDGAMQRIYEISGLERAEGKAPSTSGPNSSSSSGSPTPSE